MTSRHHREFSLVEGATAAFTSSDLINDGYTGAMVFLNINALAAGNITVHVEGKSPVGTDEYYTILDSTAITATGLTVLTIHPSVPDTSNVDERHPIPVRWRVTTEFGGGASGADYDVGFVYIP